MINLNIPVIHTDKQNITKEKPNGNDVINIRRDDFCCNSTCFGNINDEAFGLDVSMNFFNDISTIPPKN